MFVCRSSCCNLEEASSLKYKITKASKTCILDVRVVHRATKEENEGHYASTLPYYLTYWHNLMRSFSHSRNQLIAVVACSAFKPQYNNKRKHLQVRYESGQSYGNSVSQLERKIAHTSQIGQKQCRYADH